MLLDEASAGVAMAAASTPARSYREAVTAPGTTTAKDATATNMPATTAAAAVADTLLGALEPPAAASTVVAAAANAAVAMGAAALDGRGPPLAPRQAAHVGGFRSRRRAPPVTGKKGGNPSKVKRR